MTNTNNSNDTGRKRRTFVAGYTGSDKKHYQKRQRTAIIKHSGAKPQRVNRSRPIRQKPQPITSRPTRSQKNTPQVRPPVKGTIRIIPLGGVEEIGRNMTMIEYNDEIIVVDAGFQFEDASTPGVDYILANTGYLVDNKEKIKAIAITHGHLDHIGGLPYLMEEIGDVPIYTTNLIGQLILARQEEFPHSNKLKLHTVEGHEKIKVGKELGLEFFLTTHTFPDSIGIIINTSIGSVAITGDIKLNHTDGKPSKEEFDNFAKFKENPPLILLMDSTNVWKPGWSIPEHRVFETFDDIIKKHRTGRMIVGAFGSQIERLANLVKTAEKYDLKVAFEGRSLRQNMAIAERVGFFKSKKGTIIESNTLHDYPPNKVLILATGAQGDEYAALMRIAKKQHKNITLTAQDNIILSASVIPGNERAVQRLKDNISRQGAHILTVDTSDVHASGHGYMEEAKWIHQHIKPKFFIPHHGHYHMLRIHADVMHESTNLPYDHIQIPQGNSTIIELRDGGTKLVQLKERAPSVMRVVEGHKITDIQTTVIRDRKELAEEGIFVIVATFDQTTGRLRKSPDIISRGFVYLRESQEMLQKARIIIKHAVENNTKNTNVFDIDKIKADITTNIQKFLLQQTHKRPIVIPVVVSV